MWFYEARPAGFEPATRGLEVRNELTSGNILKLENAYLSLILYVSGCWRFRVVSMG